MCGPHPAVRLRWMAIVGLAIACAVSGIASAEDSAASPASEKARGQVKSQFQRPSRALTLSRDLSARAGVQLEQLAAIERSLAPGHELVDQMLFGQLSGSVKSSFERTTREMLEDLLLDATEIERHIDHLTARFQNHDRSRAPSSSPALARYERRELDFDFTVRGITPGVKMELDGRRGALKMRVDARGRVSLGYYDRRLGRAGLWVGYDGHGRFDVSARLGF